MQFHIHYSGASWVKLWTSSENINADPRLSLTNIHSSPQQAQTQSSGSQLKSEDYRIEVVQVFMTSPGGRPGQPRSQSQGIVTKEH